MKGLDLGLAIELPKTSTTSLPFQVGGVGQVASSLPFGVGAPASVISDASDEDTSTSESQAIVEQPVFEAPVVEESVVEEPIQPVPETTNEIVSNDDPWAVSEPEPLPTLEAHPSLAKPLRMIHQC